MAHADIEMMASVCFIFLANVPHDLSLLASGVTPAREAELAGGTPKVPKGQGLGPVVCSHYFVHGHSWPRLRVLRLQPVCYRLKPARIRRQCRKNIDDLIAALG